MNSSDVTVLLSTLVGGLLTMLGAFLANFYSNYSSRKAERWKELRNILEKIYKETHEIKSIQTNVHMYMARKLLITSSAEEISDEEISIEMSSKLLEVSMHMDNIRILVNLYVPTLGKNVESYSEFCNRIKVLILETFSKRDTKFLKDIPKLMAEENQNFHKEISKIAKQKRYHYL